MRVSKNQVTLLSAAVAALFAAGANAPLCPAAPCCPAGPGVGQWRTLTFVHGGVAVALFIYGVTMTVLWRRSRSALAAASGIGDPKDGFYSLQQQ